MSLRSRKGELKDLLPIKGEVLAGAWHLRRLGRYTNGVITPANSECN